MDCLCYQNARDRMHDFVHDDERLRNSAANLAYLQIGCSLLGFLGMLYNGVWLINLGIALMGLSSMDSSSRNVHLTYAVLLFCAILFDISWFIFFSHRIWKMSREGGGILFVILLRLAFVMDIVGFWIRFFSFSVWIQMCRLPVTQGDTGVSHGDTGASQVDTRVSLEDPNEELNRSLLPPGWSSSDDSDDDGSGDTEVSQLDTRVSHEDLNAKLIRRFRLSSFSSNDASDVDDLEAFDPADTNFDDPELISLLRGQSDDVRRNDSASGAENLSDSRQFSLNDTVDAIASSSDPASTNLFEDHRQLDINSLLGPNDGVIRNATGSCPDLSKIKSSPVKRALSFH